MVRSDSVGTSAFRSVTALWLGAWARVRPSADILGRGPGGRNRLTAVDRVPTGQYRLATKSVRLVSNERTLAVQIDPLALGVPAIVRWLSQGRPALVNAWSRYVSESTLSQCATVGAKRLDLLILLECCANPRINRIE